MVEAHYAVYKIRIGRSLLLGLELLVAADIVKTIALELTFTSLGLLAGLVLIRTFLSWTLVLEIEGRWPWQRGKRRPVSPAQRRCPACIARPFEQFYGREGGELAWRPSCFMASCSMS